MGTKAIEKKRIEKFLKEKLPIYLYDSIDSTNRVAKDFLDEVSPPFLVVANSQTNGRGRLGRSFYSPPDTGIYMSLALGPFEGEEALVLTPVAAVAVTDAICKLTSEKPMIKWVNDIYLKGRKICGILAEAKQINGETFVVLGIGLNMSTENFPKEISEIAGSLKCDVFREQMIAEITNNLIESISDMESRAFMERYRERSMVLGKEIYYYINEEKFSAKAIDIGKRGELIIETPLGEIKNLSGGEITLRLK